MDGVHRLFMHKLNALITPVQMHNAPPPTCVRASALVRTPNDHLAVSHASLSLDDSHGVHVSQRLRREQCACPNVPPTRQHGWREWPRAHNDHRTARRTSTRCEITGARMVMNAIMWCRCSVRTAVITRWTKTPCAVINTWKCPAPYRLSKWKW